MAILARERNNVDRVAIASVLAKSLPGNLCNDLLNDYLQIRQDVATRTIGRGAPGKFVETVVQCLEYLETGKYDKKPNVEKFLVSLESRPTKIRDDLKICVSRTARAMYALRSKRNIVHKGEVDPNSYDLRFLLSGAQWILAELVRVSGGVSMEDAGKAIDLINSPIGTLIEDVAGRRIVLADVSTPNEILLLLQSRYPDPQPLAAIVHSLNRRSEKSVGNSVRDIYAKKLIEGDTKNGYVLTRPGLESAISISQEF